MTRFPPIGVAILVFISEMRLLSSPPPPVASVSDDKADLTLSSRLCTYVLHTHTQQLYDDKVSQAQRLRSTVINVTMNADLTMQNGAVKMKGENVGIKVSSSAKSKWCTIGGCTRGKPCINFRTFDPGAKLGKSA